MPDPRYCSNCRAELAETVDACPACGVYAGDLFDERSLRPRTRRRFLFALIAAVIATAAMLVWLRMPEKVKKQTEPTSVRVVGDRPGGAHKTARAAINEAEATRLLRRHLATTTSITSTCLVIMSHGPQHGDYFFSAFNRCDRVRMGRWRVDGKSGVAIALHPAHG